MEEKTKLSKHAIALGRKGGKSTLSTHGPEHFKAMSKKRWENTDKAKRKKD